MGVSWRVCTPGFRTSPALLERVSLIDENGERRVRMAYLSVLASHKVNGVSRLHSDLIVRTIFADFARLFPDRFCNKTNGITPRRWLAQANRPLSALVDSRIGARLAAAPGRNSANCARWRRKPSSGARFAWPSSRTSSGWSSTSPTTCTGRSSTRKACSTSRSSACTNTSASC